MLQIILTLSLIYLHELSLASRYDVKMDNLQDFLKYLEKHPKENKLLRDIINNSTKFLNTKNKTNIVLNNAPIKRADEIMEKLKIAVNNPDKVKKLRDFVVDVKHQRSIEGILKLKTLAYKIQRLIDPSLSLDKIIDKITNLYVSEIDKYFNSISRNKITKEIDKEYIFLDMIEWTNQIFLNQCRSLLNAILIKTDIKLSKQDVHFVTDNIKSLCIDEKKEGLKYICDEIQICRYYPAFSDHLADVITQVLRMRDDHFVIFLDHVKEMLEAKTEFYKSIMTEDMIFKIRLKLKPLVENIEVGEKLLTDLRDVITKRYKLPTGNGKYIKLKKKATTILIEMIDKAFESLGDEITEIHFDNFKIGIRTWTKGKRNDIKTMLTDFCNNFFNMLKYNWDENTKEEVRVLIDVIMTGKSQNNIVLDDLKRKGSAFVRVDDKISPFDLITLF